MTQVSGAIIEEQLGNIKHIPPMSQTATQLLNAVSDPDIEIGDLVVVIERDPGLSARILGVANSAYFMRAGPVNSIQDAIIRSLGLNLVKGLGISIALAGSLNPKACRGFDLGRYWYEALGTAQLSRRLVQCVSPKQRPDPESVYLCGLLHNLGSLVLAHAFPDLFSRTIEQCHQDPELDPRLVQREIIGFDEVTAGEWLAVRWHLPDAVAQVIASLDADDEGQFRVHRAVIGASNRWIKRYQTDDDAGYIVDDLLITKLPGIDMTGSLVIEDWFKKQDDSLHQVSRIVA
ncbi:MAG: HDOD domain-containing protein [Gammaproteobacteria bacterium]|nr:HDOD domain-containing protein [Gammaproteobacteria bacterium]